ncbi:uncharacterized protein BXZ73DRAFT_46312 [Epithele typhae]|uniref:uncharacterized protein n=1 Tax=Epithele typhae TaxID=378194 RepID=UPI002007E99E|nr:uncharacterized protein BXZ73DRAFT_46312 [Epithele typhae]KAH9933649.1 hypothetical protein BXZ73DRAFT_46312 [Epithele typhae]
MASHPVFSNSKFSDSTVLAEVAKIRKVADVPRPATAAGKAAWAMAWTHLVVWNSWRAAYFYADKVPTGDFEAFHQYATRSIQFLVEHHDAEESSLFPELEKKIPGSMAKNEEQHKAFLGPLGDMLKYVESSTAEKFDAATFRGQMDAILPAVMEHLAEELDTIEAGKLSDKLSEEEITALNTALHMAQRGDDNKFALPFVVQSLPPGCGFPPAPGFVKTVIGPWMLYWKYASLWKYTAYPWKASLEPVPDF